MSRGENLHTLNTGSRAHFQIFLAFPVTEYSCILSRRGWLGLLGNVPARSNRACAFFSDGTLLVATTTPFWLVASTWGPPWGRRENLLFLNFNQDSGCFACGTDAGFRIYNCDPFKETFRRRFDDAGGGGIGVVEMLFRCNILALVGGGRSPRYSPNKVMIWDDHQSRCIGELSFRVEVRAVRLRRDKIVVVLEHKIYVYNFADLKILHQTDTVANPKGLCALSPTQGNTVMAFPGLNKGQVRVELYDAGVTKFISAHDGDLAQLALSLDGERLATSSEKGTLVRVYDPAKATLLHEFRRGADRATIYSITFSPEKDFLACTSDKGTVHVYATSSRAGGDRGVGGPGRRRGHERAREPEREG